jgi:hypothetical protein
MSAVKFNRLKLTNIKVVTSDVNTTVPSISSVSKFVTTQTGANFGYSVDISTTDDTLLVGAPDTDFGGAINAGAVKYYNKNASDIWTGGTIISASDRAIGDRFGHSITVNSSGTVFIAGAPKGNLGISSDAGAAYIFTKNSSDIWSQKQKIFASDFTANVEFGTSVAINAAGDMAAICSIPYNVTRGSVYIFTKNPSDVWNQQQKIISSDSTNGTLFGQSMSMNPTGDLILVGNPKLNSVGVNAGAVKLFKKNVSDIWSVTQLLSSDTQAGDYFGQSVTINDNSNVAIIGAPMEDTGGSNAGAAYIFSKNTSDIWIEKQKIISSDIQAGDYFGWSVSINSNGTIALVGAKNEDTGATNRGSAYIFTKSSSDLWSQQQKIQPSDNLSNFFFGQSVVLNSIGDESIVGATPITSSSSDSIFIFKYVVSNIPVGGVSYNNVNQYELFVMKSDNVINYKA